MTQVRVRPAGQALPRSGYSSRAGSTQVRVLPRRYPGHGTLHRDDSTHVRVSPVGRALPRSEYTRQGRRGGGAPAQQAGQAAINGPGLGWAYGPGGE